MTDGTRAAIAFLIGTLVTEQKRSGVFDHSRGRFVGLSSATGTPHLLVYSQPENVHLQAHVRPAGIRLMDFANNCYLRLSIQGRTFSISEEDTRAVFNGMINNNLIYIFEQKGKRHWNYSF